VVVAQLTLRAAEMEYCMTQLTMAVYYAIVVMGLCLLMGYAGQVSLGHGSFFAIGGYTSAVLTTHDFSALKGSAGAGWLQQAHLFIAKQDLYGNATMTVSPWAAFVAAMLVTFLIALLIGYPALRLRGHYLAMATLGFGLIVSKMLLGSNITGSADGINAVPEWKLIGGLTVTGKSAERVQNYYIACGLALLLLVLLRNLVHSRVGRALQAIHDRETAANAMGIDTARYKLKVFVLSALLAAMVVTVTMIVTVVMSMLIAWAFCNRGQVASDTRFPSAALIVCPYYNRPTQEGLYLHYRAIAEEVPIPIVVYNIQGRTGVNMATRSEERRVGKEC
jgi:branched-chain amino acid transport system permease protein